MKLAFSILCGWLLALAPALSSQASPVCVGMASPATCGCGGKMPCCAKRSAPHSNSAPLATTNAGGQNQNSVPAPSIIGWLPPVDEISLPSSISASALISAGMPLYERNCALLI